MPGRNLVKNIGFSEGAPHTNIPDPARSDLDTFEMQWPLRKLGCDAIDCELDKLIGRVWFKETWANAVKSLMLLLPFAAKINAIKKNIIC